MRAIKSKNTGIEKILFAIAKEFWNDHRYRKHFRIHKIRPELWFPRARLVIFADGDFWHGRNLEIRMDKLLPYWQQKIVTNVERDVRQQVILESAGIRVLRFWGTDLIKDPAGVKETIRNALYGAEVTEAPASEPNITPDV